LHHETALISNLNKKLFGFNREVIERLKTGILTMQPPQKFNHLEDALTVISSAAQLYPDSRNLARHHAELLAQCGRDGDALNACEAFLTSFGVVGELLSLALRLRQQIGSHDRLTEAGALSISLCMIVKNEEKCLARCLASLKPVVDEMIIIDTGSSDRTVDIAVAFGARVFDVTWTGDFSAARNYSLSKAHGRWILVMDADEVLSERDYPYLQKLLQSHTGKQVAWSVVTRNYTNRTESEGWHANDGRYPEQEQGDGWYSSKKVRLFPALQSVKFQGDIHEMVEADLRTLAIPIEQADFVVHHFGELTDVDRRAKQVRYYEMGKQKLLERPDDVMAALELAVQAGELEMYDEALELWDNLLSRGIISLDIYFNRSYVLMGLNRFSEASDMARKAMEIDPDHKESAHNYGMCMLNLGHPEQAAAFVAQESTKHPDYPLLMALLCVIYLCTGEVASALAISEKLSADNYEISGYIKARVAVLEQRGHLTLALLLQHAADTMEIKC
jgi:glycosyltransferase involved in cell wall biosynthesis